LVLTVFTEHQSASDYNNSIHFWLHQTLAQPSCLEGWLISELQGAPGSRDHQASPSSLFGYQTQLTW